MTYTQAIELLSHSTLLERPLWGADLNSEQERWLVEHHCNNTPLIVTDYPKGKQHAAYIYIKFILKKLKTKYQNMKN